ncbi:Polyadenylate-binding protein 4, partial [Physocladia obscura]
MSTTHDPLDAFPTVYISGLPPTITELDIVNVMSNNNIEAKVVIERDPVTLAPRVRVVFRYIPDAERFFATVNGSAFLGSKVNLTFKDPNMNFSNTSGSKTVVVKRIPLSITSLELYDAVRPNGRIIFCKVMMDRGGLESYALLQFEEQAAAERCIAEMNGFILKGSAVTFSWQFPKNSTHIYPSMRSNSMPQQPNDNQSIFAPQRQQLPGLEGGINLALSAGWSEQPLTPISDDSYGPYNSNNKRQSWIRDDNSGSLPRNTSSPRPTSTVNVLPTTGWHSRTTVNPSLIVSEEKLHSNIGHKWDEAVTITLEDLKSISPAHAALASQFEPKSSHGASSPDLLSPTSSSVGSVGAISGLDQRNLYIKNLPIDPIFDTEDLYALFSSYGQIISAKVMKDENTWISKGFGFVSYSSEQEAALAISELNGYLLNPALPKGLV